MHKRNRTAFSVPDDLTCEDCRQIDFSKVLDLDAATLQYNEGGIFIANLGTLCDQILRNDCALCQLFSGVRIPANLPQEPQGYQLRAYSFLKHYNSIQYSLCPKGLKNKDHPFLAVVPRNFDGRNLSLGSGKAGYLFCSTKDGEQKGDLHTTTRIQSFGLFQRGAMA